jgi:hypothetical protein
VRELMFSFFLTYKQYKIVTICVSVASIHSYSVHHYLFSQTSHFFGAFHAFYMMIGVSLLVYVNPLTLYWKSTAGIWPLNHIESFSLIGTTVAMANWLMWNTMKMLHSYDLVQCIHDPYRPYLFKIKMKPFVHLLKPQVIWKGKRVNKNLRKRDYRC